MTSEYAADPSTLSSTLLARVRAQRPEAWERLVRLYSPVIYRWCRRAGLRPEDAADVLQESLAAVTKYLPEFRRDDSGHSFTAWLATITRNKIRDHYRRRLARVEACGGSAALRQLADVAQPPELSDDSVQADAASQALLSQRGLELIRAEFENRTWNAFWRTAVEGIAPAVVADELGMSVAAVYMARSRVTRRLRQELHELLE